MNATEVLNRRLQTQGLMEPPFARPEGVVSLLCGVQSQDVSGAIWSVGQRTAGCREADALAAFNAGTFIRTHLLRPTWHFVAPADIRWLLALTAPHVHALNAYYYRKLELDAAIFARSETLFAAALQGGKHLTRTELAATLAAAGIIANSLRLSYIMMHAELTGLICSGAMRGKQQTYALLDERVAPARPLARDEALTELTRRFFIGHGPASLKDYVRWSGLSVAAAKTGLEVVKESLVSVVVDGQTLWFGDALPPPEPVSFRAYFLPEYDECVLTYPDLNFQNLPVAGAPPGGVTTFDRPIIIGEQRAGAWRRTITKGAVLIEAQLIADLDDAQTRALDAAVTRYGAFLGLPIQWKFSTSYESATVRAGCLEITA